MTDETTDALHRLARVLAGAALAGGGARLALGAIQPASYPAPAPKPPPRVTVPLVGPAADEDEPGGVPRIALPPAKSAQEGPSHLGSLDIPGTGAFHTPEWFDRLYQSIVGGPPPRQTPMTDTKAWAPVAMVGGGVAGGLGGWLLGDKLVRAHQRALAARELERSKRDYLDAAYGGGVKASYQVGLTQPPPMSTTPPLAVARPLAVTPPVPGGPPALPPVKPTLPPVMKAPNPAPAASNPPAPKPAAAAKPSTKAAALAAQLLGDPADPYLKAAKTALDTAFDGFTKAAADDDFAHSLWYRWLFPGTNFGPFGSAANLGVAALMGAGGAYGGYRYARNTDLERLRREQLDAAEREDQADRPPVVVGELRPPTKSRPLSFAAGRLGPAA